ncbi:RNA polymerase sigma factor SigI [Marinithermofilum abyssi]|uniref:RNA polymerase sigma factor SigI n=1 Tax=Marinithermofilum abyssi TaxID=1571185 RepID=A0A8J2VDD5_9BACL|nr:RNA polymerase sigma-I factor [Marinithermofilum abyssi]GGE08242.1 RNA polymerase sigma factor SigI [Marinithermofilum abyssi]
MRVPGDGERDEKRRQLEERVLKAKASQSTEQREELLREHRQHIVRIASRICNRTVTMQDDEYSIALSGFDEAIQRYEEGQSSSFLSFAYMVIQRRLIDFFRREKKHLLSQVPLVSPGSKDNEPNYPEMVEQSFDHYREKELGEMRREEVVQFTKALSRFGIGMSDLVDASPKHRDTRKEMLEVARRLVADNELLKQFYEQKRIKKELAERVGCHRRTLKRHRTYLIALTLVLVEELPLMREYLGWPSEQKGGGDCAEGDRDGNRSAVLGHHDAQR